MAIIETHGLKKTFTMRKKVIEAVRGVDLLVNEGEIFGFLGPNGAGKTTTMRMLATLLEPSGGEAQVAGFDLRREPAKIREYIGYVSQTGGAEASATARENLILQARLYGLNRATANMRTERLIKTLELSTFADRLVSTLSGGQRRRLDLAMGMVHRPKLLFLDEPTSGLDPQSRARLWDEVRQLSASGVTIFLTTHYLEEADALCHRLAIIDDGRIISEGTPDGLKQQVAGDSILLGLDKHSDAFGQLKELLSAQQFVREMHETEQGIQLYVEQSETALPELIRLCEHKHVQLNTITMARPTLDDVFLRITGRSLRESSTETAIAQ